MFPMTSTREGIERSPDTTSCVRAWRDAMQSLCQRPSVWQWWTPSLKTDPEWQRRLRHTSDSRHFLRSRKSKKGCSTNFSRYPLPASSLNVSRSTCEPPIRATSHTEGPTTLWRCSRTAASRLASPLLLLSTATHTLLNVSRSHVRTKSRVASVPSSNALWTGHTTSPSSQPASISLGTSHASSLTADISSMKINYVIFRSGYVCLRNQIRIYGEDADTNQYFFVWPADFNVNWAHNCFRVHSSHPVAEIASGTELWPEWAAADRQHQVHPWLNPRKKDIHDHVAQVVSVWSEPAKEQLPHLAEKSRWNPALSTQVSLSVTADPSRNISHPGSAAESQKNLGSAQTIHADRVDSRNDWASPRDLSDQLQTAAQVHRIPRPSCFFWSLIWQDSLLSRIHNAFVSTGVCCFYYKPCRLRRLRLQPIQYVVKFCKDRKHNENRLRNNPWKRMDDDTNFSSRDPESVPFPPQTQPCKA